MSLRVNRRLNNVQRRRRSAEYWPFTAGYEITNPVHEGDIYEEYNLELAGNDVIWVWEEFNS